MFKHDIKYTPNNLINSNIQPVESESNDSPTHLIAESPWSLLPVAIDRRQSEMRLSRRLFSNLSPAVQTRYHPHSSLIANKNNKRSKIIAMSKLKLLPNGYSQITIRRTTGSSFDSKSNSQSNDSPLKV